MQNIVLWNSYESTFAKPESRQEGNGKIDSDEGVSNILIVFESQGVLVAGCCEWGDEHSCCI
jgi:hypothetical protein